jgi:hypothetical protein
VTMLRLVVRNLCRNLSPEQASYLRGRQYELEKNGRGRPEGKRVQSAPLKTAAKLALKHKVSQDTIKRDAQFARAVDTIAEAARASNISLCFQGVSPAQLVRSPRIPELVGE